MQIEARLHEDDFWVLPSLGMHRMRCQDEACGATHGWAVELAWLFFSIALVFPTAR